jgi:hypothetical protein
VQTYIHTHVSLLRGACMASDVKLTTKERAMLDRIRERLGKDGLRLSSERLMVALLKAAANLNEDDLTRLMREGLREDTTQNDTK